MTETTADNGHNSRNHTFRDRLGREWDVTLTLASAQRIDRSDFTELTKMEVKILQPSKELFSELLTNKPLAMGVIWAIVHRQAEQMQPPVTDLDFLEAIDGRAVTDALAAFWETLADFFPQAKTAISDMRALQIKAEEVAQAGLAKMSPAALREVERLTELAVTEFHRELESLTPGGKSSPASVASA